MTKALIMLNPVKDSFEACVIMASTFIAADEDTPQQVRLGACGLERVQPPVA
jgi:hypothetical protein